MKSRLRRSDFLRRQEESVVHTNRIIILSVEGTRTEPSYFKNMNIKLSNNGRGTIIQVEVLKHEAKPGANTPKDVLALLDEYTEVTNNGKLVPPETIAMLESKFGEVKTQKYLNHDQTLDKKSTDEIYEALLAEGIDLPYLEHLCASKDIVDHLGILIDRDKDCHSPQELEEVMNICGEKGYGFYISNPCFELWLLLHFHDIHQDYKDRLNDIIENRKVSTNHTFLSKEISNIAGHTKSITFGQFAEKYWPNIKVAIERAKKLETSPEKIMTAIGTNLPELFDILLDGEEKMN